MSTASPFRLDGLSAVITGAGSGIGRATALAFAASGAARLVLAGRTRAKLEETVRQLPTGCATVLVDGDLTHAEVRARLVAAAGTELDVLVNNAGLFDGLSAAATTDEIWRRNFATNVDAPFALARDLLPALTARRGNVVNVSSTLAVKPIPVAAAYNAAKAALSQMTRSLALELGPVGVRVNCVLPAIIETPMFRDRYDGPEAYAKGMAEAAKLHPLGRVGSPEDVAHAIVFLAGPAAGWVTGVELPVDGGMLVT